MILPVTLTSAAAAALIAIWLMVRVGQLRIREKVLHGDGGNPSLLRRMRAQINFVESVPFVLVLIAGIEMAGKGGAWLAYVAGIFMLARVAHAIGMDAEKGSPLRTGGITVTILTLLGLAVVATLIPLGMF